MILLVCLVESRRRIDCNGMLGVCVLTRRSRMAPDINNRSARCPEKEKKETAKITKANNGLLVSEGVGSLVYEGRYPCDWARLGSSSTNGGSEKGVEETGAGGSNNK